MTNPDETPRSKFNNILLARPEGMDYNEYKLIRKYQQLVIKQYLKGSFRNVRTIGGNPDENL